MGAPGLRTRVVRGLSTLASLLSRPFGFCLGAGKRELSDSGDSNFATSPANQEGDDHRSSNKAASGRTWRSSSSLGSTPELSEYEAVPDLPLGFGQKKECPEGGSQPSQQPGPGMKPLEKSPTLCEQTKIVTSDTALDVPADNDATSCKAISAADAPEIVYHLDADRNIIIEKASLPADLPVIAEGAYGKVLAGKVDDQAVALKVPLSGGKAGIKSTGATRSPREGPVAAAVAKEVLSLQSELDSLRSLTHPNIVRVMGTVVASDGVPALAGIILPFFPQGSLRTLMLTRGGKPSRQRPNLPLPNQVVMDLALGLFKGLEHMHKNKWCHFDIKLDNVLVSEEGGKLVAIIADLGMAKRADPQGNFGLTSFMRGPFLAGDHQGHTGIRSARDDEAQDDEG